MFNTVRGNIISNPPDTNIRFNANIHNRFDIEVVDTKTGNVRTRAEAFNVVCNNLWTSLFSKTAYFRYIHYGDGEGTPSAGDSSLFSFIAYKSVTSDGGKFDFDASAFIYRGHVQILENESVGKNITEVGIASGTEASTLCTHAMLRDMNGNPVSIKKTDTDIINIHATIYVHVSSNGYSDNSVFLVTDNTHLDYNLLARLAGSGTTGINYMHVSAGNSLVDGQNNSFIPGYGDSSDWEVAETLNAANKTITFTGARIAASSANGYHGLTRVFMGRRTSSGYLRTYPFLILRVGGEWFPHSEITGESVGTGDGTTTDFALKFNFAHDAKVYIDGVETSDFQLDYGIHTDDFAGEYTYMYMFESIEEASDVDNHIPRLCKSGYQYGSSSAYPYGHKPYHILYNPAHASAGLGQLYVGSSCKIESSNDLKTWVTITDGSSEYKTIAIPEEYQHYKYWKYGAADYTGGSTFSTYYANNFRPVSGYTGKVLHFNTPPAEGSVITVDYLSDTIAKDANHVFDVSVTIHLGEYTEAQ